MNKSINKKQKMSSAQSGVALPIVLIFLVVMLLLGVTAIRNVTLGEKMAGNQNNQQLAFQAAEKALRYCEAALQTNPIVGVALNAPNMKLTDPPTNNWDVLEYWSDNAVSVSLPAASKNSDGTSSDGLLKPPRCMVEDVKGTLRLRNVEERLDPTIRAYRVTARGTGGTDNAVVMLQSYLKFN